MLKKLALAFVASAFALALAAPTADACPGMDKGDKSKVVKKDSKKKPAKIAKKREKKSKKKASKKAKKN